ncbi:MAG TPA: DOPA 4,5-dioxygenase family protein [Acetobacteraceae bacterium]|nr:DOPA 4,5-dioxygenase family protein [Acetobacteraceae bacterium]
MAEPDPPQATPEPGAAPRSPPEAIHSYHAHVYFDAASRDRAARLREQIADRFRVQLGRWREAPVGPHARPMYQVAFTPDLFGELVPWLMLNRMGLPVMVHPNTDSPHDDHLAQALWLGEQLPIDAGMLPRSLRETGATHDPVEPNTGPA